VLPLFHPFGNHGLRMRHRRLPAPRLLLWSRPTGPTSTAVVAGARDGVATDAIIASGSGAYPGPYRRTNGPEDLAVSKYHLRDQRAMTRGVRHTHSSMWTR